MATIKIDDSGLHTHPGGGVKYPFEEQVLPVGAILPAQFYNDRAGRPRLEPLTRLMMAVLVDAIGCYQRNLGAKALLKQREFKEAERWLFRDKRDYLFSFEHVCDLLNTDPNRLREAVMHWQRSRITGVAPRRLMRKRN